MRALLFPFIIVAIGFMTVVALLSQDMKVNKKDTFKSSIKHISHSIDNFNGETFTFYNYLKKNVRVEVVKLNGKEVKPVVIAKIFPQKSVNVDLRIIERYLITNTTFRIVLFDSLKPDWEERIFAYYEMNIPEDTTIKQLHIGMLTSKYVGASDFDLGQRGISVQGMPWLKIHNLTLLPLQINENINITPEGMLRYTGRQHMNVSLGTVFKDMDDIFPTYIYTVPASDLYWGVVSDIQQPLFGGFQLTPEFYDDDFTPNDMQQLNYLSGPAFSNITPGFLPIEGPTNIPSVDRWGQM